MSCIWPAGPLLAQVFSAPDLHEWNRWENSAFTTNLSLLTIADGVAYDQDAASVQQVGKQGDEIAWRAERFLLGGQLKFERPWFYVMGVNFNSFEAEKPDRWTLLDLRVGIPIFRSARLRIGRQKVGVSQEWLIPGNDMVKMERSTVDLAFVPQRSNGLLLMDNFAGERGLWSLGAFNDWLTTGNGFSENGNQYSTRVSYLLADKDNGATLVQIAGALFYREATEGSLQFRARPEINEADYFIDTGKFSADYAVTSQVEMAVIKGPLMVVANMTFTPVSAPQSDPHFHGWYGSVSYALTGEHRAFNRLDGHYGVLLPRSSVRDGGIGSWEVSARYSSTDLTDRTIEGGEISCWSGGLSWVPSRPWRLELSYGYSTLNRGGLTGHTPSVSARVQWFPF